MSLSYYRDNCSRPLLPLLPPELALEIISCVLEPGNENDRNQPSNTSSSTFPSRVKTLTNLSLTTPSLRNLILSSPTFWSSIEINVIQDIIVSPPLSCLNDLFERSKGVKMEVRIVHWGEERRQGPGYDDNINKNRGWERVPGVMRDVMPLLERHERRIEKLRFDFYDLNGTEYASQQTGRRCQWVTLKHLELHAADWGVVHSMSMSWIEAILMAASPEIVVVQGNGPFGWGILGKNMSRLRSLRVETEIPERLALDIISQTPALESCTFGRIIRVSSSSPQSRSPGFSEGGIVLPWLMKLHIGSPRGPIGPFLNSIATPRLAELGVDFVETNKTRWDREVFTRFIARSGLECRLKRWLVKKGAMSEADLKICQVMFSQVTTIVVVQ